MAKIKKKKKEKIVNVDEDMEELKLTHIGGRSECKNGAATVKNYSCPPEV